MRRTSRRAAPARARRKRVALAEESEDPIERFRVWFESAARARAPLPETVVVATADARGRPSCRYVLRRVIAERGVVFLTDARSRKGRDVRVNGHASVAWYWNERARQVRIEGSVVEISAAESDAYWETELRTRQLAVAVCRQSAPIARREDLVAAFAAARARFAGRPIPRPREWTGFRVVPQRIEFWIHRKHELHERISYERTARGWRRGELQP